MAVFTGRTIFMLIFIKVYGCTVTERDVYICCEDIYANGMYKYSINTNWTTDELHSEEWASEEIPLALIDHAHFSKNWTAEVKQVFSGNIYLKTCLNLTYSATDIKFKEMHNDYNVMGCSKEKSQVPSKVTTEVAPYVRTCIAVVAIILVIVIILVIEWKIGCLRRRFSRHRNVYRPPADDQNAVGEDEETPC